MDIFTRALKNTIKGEWRVKLENGEVINIITPTLEETLHIEQEAAIAYNDLILRKMPDLASVVALIQKECDAASLDYSIIEKKYEIFKNLFESIEYSEMLAQINDIPLKTFKVRMQGLMSKYVDTQTLAALQKVENIYEKHYRRTAEYFSYFAKMKMLVYYSVFDENKNRVFKKIEDIGLANPSFLEEIIFYVKEHLIPSGKEAFFLF